MEPIKTICLRRNGNLDFTSFQPIPISIKVMINNVFAITPIYTTKKLSIKINQLFQI